MSTSAAENLLLVLREWRRRTVAETAAIRAENWPAARECQSAKRELQALFGAETSAARLDPEASALLSEVISLETENLKLLEVRKAALKTRQKELETSFRNLRRMRKSYQTAAPAVWQSYS